RRGAEDLGPPRARRHRRHRGSGRARRARAGDSNKASSYAQANMPVEALDAFQQRRDLYANELSVEVLHALDDAIANLRSRIGTVVLGKGPAGVVLEVHLDGRMAPKALAVGPVRMAQGDHSVEITAEGYHPMLDEFTVVPGRETVIAPKLVPLET